MHRPSQVHPKPSRPASPRSPTRVITCRATPALRRRTYPAWGRRRPDGLPPIRLPPIRPRPVRSAPTGGATQARPAAVAGRACFHTNAPLRTLLPDPPTRTVWCEPLRSERLLPEQRSRDGQADVAGGEQGERQQGEARQGEVL